MIFQKKKIMYNQNKIFANRIKTYSPLEKKAACKIYQNTVTHENVQIGQIAFLENDLKIVIVLLRCRSWTKMGSSDIDL